MAPPTMINRDLQRSHLLVSEAWVNPTPVSHALGNSFPRNAVRVVGLIRTSPAGKASGEHRKVQHMPPGLRPSRKFATTMGHFAAPPFSDHARVIRVPPALDRLPRGRFRLSDEVCLFMRVLWAALHESRLLLFSSRGRLKPELLAIVCIGLWPRRLRPRIVLYGEMFEPNSGLRAVLERYIMRLADRTIARYVVYSSEECHIFPRLWGVDPAKLRVALLYARRQPQEQEHRSIRGTHIFAGGNSFREYAPLVEAARLLPQYRFVIATTKGVAVTDLPPNVQVGPLAPDQYATMVKTATAVVVPLRRDVHRLVGQMTYFEAMGNRTPPIVTDTVGVRDYIQDGITGLVVDGSPEGYVTAIRWMCDPTHAAQVQWMGDQAYAVLHDRFTLTHHLKALMTVMDELSEQQRPAVEVTKHPDL